MICIAIMPSAIVHLLNCPIVSLYVKTFCLYHQSVLLSITCPFLYNLHVGTKKLVYRSCTVRTLPVYIVKMRVLQRAFRSFISIQIYKPAGFHSSSCCRCRRHSNDIVHVSSVENGEWCYTFKVPGPVFFRMEILFK